MVLVAETTEEEDKYYRLEILFCVNFQNLD